MKYLITITLLMMSAPGWSQPDTERMNRDIEVAENILASLISEENEQAKVPHLLFNNIQNVEGSYIEGFGVLFSINASHFHGVVTWQDGDVLIGKGSGRAILTPEPGKATNKDEKIVVDSSATEKFFKKVAQLFLVDYAYLLRQLPENEKVMVRYGGNRSPLGLNVISARSEKSTYSASVEKSNLDAFRKDQISRSQLLDRIKFVISDSESIRKDRDLELLSSIFSRLYKEDLSEDFSMRRYPTYEKIKGLGAVLYFTVGTKSASLAGVYNLHARAFDRYARLYQVEPEDEKPEEEIDEEEQREKMIRAYSDFLEELKVNIVEYGSTVKTLGADESLIFRIRISGIDVIEQIPEKLDITAGQATLEAYRKGRTSLEDAVDELNVLEVEKK